MTNYRNISRIIVEFQDREGVEQALIVDGSLPESDLMADVTVDDDGLTAAISIEGIVPNGTGYGFKSLEEWRTSFVRRVAEAHEDGQGVKKAPEMGPVGRVTWYVIGVSVAAPLLWLLWDATIRWIQR